MRRNINREISDQSWTWAGSIHGLNWLGRVFEVLDWWGWVILWLVPRCRLSTYGRRAFSCAGPAAWNSLADRLKNSTLTVERFRRLLKSFLFFPATSAWNAVEVFMIMRYINSHLHLNNIYIYVVERLSMTIYGYAQSVFILVYFILSISDKNVWSTVYSVFIFLE